MELLKALKKAFSSNKLHTKLIQDYVIKEAFTFKGIKYYMFNDPMEVSSGRGLYAMTYYEELLARVDREYLEYHTKAVDNILSDPSKTDIPAIVKLNENLKERLDLKVALPEHVYKFASIVFFDESESPFRYDRNYNDKKIKSWEKEGGAYDFFLQTPLKQLIPFLDMPKQGTQQYLAALEKIKKRHLAYAQLKALGKI